MPKISVVFRKKAPVVDSVEVVAEKKPPVEQENICDSTYKSPQKLRGEFYEYLYVNGLVLNHKEHGKVKRFLNRYASAVKNKKKE